MEAYVNLYSIVVEVLHGRDSRSVCASVPDPRVKGRGFHAVTLVDMGDTAGPGVSVADISLLRLQWPVSIVNSLSWLQQELEQHLPLRTVCVPRETSGSGIRIRNLPANLAGRALPMHRMPRLS